MVKARLPQIIPREAVKYIKVLAGEHVLHVMAQSLMTVLPATTMLTSQTMVGLAALVNAIARLIIADQIVANTTVLARQNVALATDQKPTIVSFVLKMREMTQLDPTKDFVCVKLDGRIIIADTVISMLKTLVLIFYALVLVTSAHLAQSQRIATSVMFMRSETRLVSVSATQTGPATTATITLENVTHDVTVAPDHRTLHVLSVMNTLEEVQLQIHACVMTEQIMECSQELIADFTEEIVTINATVAIL